MKWNMPIGVDNFKKVKEQYYFIDKTDFIRQFLDFHKDVTLFTRPRRFGKTLTMSMLDYFFSIDKKEDSKDLFKDTKISQAGPKYTAEQSKYPVIFLSLKDCADLTWNDMLEQFKGLIQREYQKHRYLLDSDALYPEEKEQVRRFIQGTGSRVEYQQSLWLLTMYLERYFCVKPIILIDEYDAPLQAAYSHGFYDEGIAFFRRFFSMVLKGNDSLRFAILTGVLRIAKESIFSGLNNLDVCSVLSTAYGDVFGFTEAEVQLLLGDTGYSGKMDEVKAWYDGYSIGGVDMYNPWSVLQYIDKGGEPAPYWVNTSGNDILHELLRQVSSQRIQSLQQLLEGKTIQTAIDEGVIYKTIGSNDAALYTMMLMTGYLKAVRKETTDSGVIVYDVKIPNEEITRLYRREILDSAVDGVHINQYMSFQEALIHGNGREAKERLQDILSKMVSFYDTGRTERFYHGLVLGLTSLLEGPAYHVVSNRESGYGRFDVAIFPTNQKRAGVIMEFKVASSENDLSRKATEALQQIEEKKYAAEFTNLGIQTVWKYGIAFCGKTVLIQQV